MPYDPHVPTCLKREQLWFGSIISRPIDDQDQMTPISPTGTPMEIEAAEHILPSPTMPPAQRIQIYNQQYWWRILKALQDTFPLLTCLFGTHDFNHTFGFPYLSSHAPRHWSLHLVGDRLVAWIRETYQPSDRELVLNASMVDWAFTESCFAPAYPPLTNEQLPDNKPTEELTSVKLFLQPHIRLFDFPCDLFTYRKAFLENPPEHWIENDFPKLEHSRNYCHVLYRNKKHDLSWQEISLPEQRLLAQFRAGATIDQLCDWLERQDENELSARAMDHLHDWLQDWIRKGWLSLGELPSAQKPWESIVKR